MLTLGLGLRLKLKLKLRLKLRRKLNKNNTNQAQIAQAPEWLTCLLNGLVCSPSQKLQITHKYINKMSRAGWNRCTNR